MKFWIEYLKKCKDSDLWGFVLLDYYHQHEKAKDKHDDPSNFIDNVINEILTPDVDPVSFHQVLLCVCIQLLGNDFSEIIKKSIKFLKHYDNLLKKDQLIKIIAHYEVYGKSDVFSRKLTEEGIYELDKINEDGKEHEDIMEHKYKTNQNTNSPESILFYSYSHEDQKLRDNLEKHLKLLEREGYITGWYDRKIIPGSNFEDEIDENLKKARIILLLVSADFINSEYCFCKEMTFAIEQHQKGEAKVIPVILRSCDWTSAPFGKLLALPTDGKPVISKTWNDVDEALTDVAKGIRRVVDEIRNS